MGSTLPVGQIAEDLIKELEEEINVRQKEIEQYRGSIEGIKHFVYILKERATGSPAGGTGTVVPSPKTEGYKHPSSGT